MTGALMFLADSDWNSHMGNWGAGWWILMTAMMVAFLGLVILGIVWVVRSPGPGQTHHAHPDGSALEVLDRRLAGGEISPEEYSERRDLLQGQGTGGGSKGG